MRLAKLFGLIDLPDAFHYDLDDGTRTLVRPVRREDAPRLRAGFERLSHLARRRRFLEHIDELTDAHLEELVDVDDVDHVAWGALDLANPEVPGVGVARYVRLVDDREAADVAVTVADEYAGRGASLVLMCCLHLAAHRNGIRRFYFDVLADNERFINQLHELGAEHVGRVVNVTRVRMPVFSRPGQIPDHTHAGQRLAAVFRRVGEVDRVAEAA